MEQVTGVRYSGELGHPFHVVDEDLVVLSLDIRSFQRTFCFTLGSDRELAQKLAEDSRRCGLKPCGAFGDRFSPGVSAKRGSPLVGTRDQ